MESHLPKSTIDSGPPSGLSGTARKLSVIEQPRILIVDQWRGEDLIALMRGQVLAIRRKNFFPPDKCQQLAERLLGSGLYGRYANAPAIGRVGTAYFECQADEAIREAYQENAVPWIREMRDRGGPALTPFDKLRLELDEAWLAGAYLATFNRRKAFGGLARHFAKGSEAEPHQDVLAWDDPHTAAATGISGQFAWNTYLDTAAQGGRLLLFGFPLTKKQYEAWQNPGSYGVRRDLLPEPIEVIAPDVGEAIIFNSGCLHAVETIYEGSRVTQSCFIGYRDVHDPLLFWS